MLFRPSSSPPDFLTKTFNKNFSADFFFWTLELITAFRTNLKFKFWTHLNITPKFETKQQSPRELISFEKRERELFLPESTPSEASKKPSKSDRSKTTGTLSSWKFQAWFPLIAIGDGQLEVICTGRMITSWLWIDQNTQKKFHTQRLHIEQARGKRKSSRSPLSV